MNPKKILLSFAPWIVFSVLTRRVTGTHIVAPAAFGAAALSLLFILKDKATSGVKLIDATSCATFAGLGLIAKLGSTGLQVHIEDYGRGIAAFILGAVMLASVAVLPFTEQYARESVPETYWHSPVFRAVNRKISAAFGLATLAMGCSHIFSGHYDPASAAISSRRPVEIFCDWVVPLIVIGLAGLYTKKLMGPNEREAAVQDQMA